MSEGPAPRFADVAFNLPAAGAFTYAIGENEGCRIGARVSAPFGRRTLVGFVVGAHVAAPEGGYSIRTIDRVIEGEPLFDESYLALARWVAGMYICSLGEALASMLPGGR
ncbi:MAG TPA: primosomal protein N', partial [Spirochaetia bacterium]|nr:primosomal protein N' [Spirochaetia bacterium]